MLAVHISSEDLSFKKGLTILDHLRDQTHLKEQLSGKHLREALTTATTKKMLINTKVVGKYLSIKKTYRSAT